MSSGSYADPLDYIDFDDILQHGMPENWKYIGPKPGSPVPAHSSRAQPGTMKHYDIYEDELGEEIEVHFFSTSGWNSRGCQG